MLETTPAGAVTWTRGELRAKVTGVVDLLDAHEVPVGAMVPALLSNHPASVAALVAGAISNRPLAPFAPRMTEAELLQVLRRIPGDILLVEDESARLGEVLGAKLGKRAVLVDRARTGDGVLRPHDDPERTAFVMHTSGTTGAPKRVEVRDGRVARRADVNGYLLGLTPHDRLVTTSLFHHVGAMGNFAVALGSGAAIVMFPQFSVEAWRQLRRRRADGVRHHPDGLRDAPGQRCAELEDLAPPGLRRLAHPPGHHAADPGGPPSRRLRQSVRPDGRLSGLGADRGRSSPRARGADPVAAVCGAGRAGCRAADPRAGRSRRRRGVDAGSPLLRHR